jgi:methylenetetrahydrofolate dehydrogenase (NADP+)/methenyltetrahydrofolate cyclohydrolase
MTLRGNGGIYKMTASLINGKEIAKKMREEMKREAAELSQTGIRPGLSVILVGEDPASQAYVRNKAKACEEVGFHSEIIRMPASTSQDMLIRKIDELNENPNIHGILVQLPLPKPLNEDLVIGRIHPDKDVDGFHPYNIGNLVIGHDAFVPCTPLGVMELIRRTGVSVAGKHAVVVGRSNIVGKPMALLLLREHATVTICHSRTENLADITKQADILIAAVGRPLMLDERHVKPGAIVIDVGINRNEEGKLVGDVNRERVMDTAGYITPVPGGVGPMTIAMLLQNTLKSAKFSASKQKTVTR